jgi:hypothetical protein
MSSDVTIPKLAPDETVVRDSDWLTMAKLLRIMELEADQSAAACAGVSQRMQDKFKGVAIGLSDAATILEEQGSTIALVKPLDYTDVIAVMVKNSFAAARAMALANHQALEMPSASSVLREGGEEQ